MMTFNACPFNLRGPSTATSDAPDGSPSDKADESTADDFAAAMAETWFVPQNLNPAETVEEKAAQGSPAGSGADNQPAMPVALLGPPVTPPACWTKPPADLAAPPVEGTDSEPVPKAAFSIVNLFAAKPLLRTEAEMANAASGTPAANENAADKGADICEAANSSLTAASAGLTAASADEAAEPGFLGLSKLLAKSSPEPVPKPVMLADPPRYALDGGPQREPGLRPFPRGSQGISLFGDVPAGLFHSPWRSDLSDGRLPIPGLARRFNLGEVSLSASITSDSKGEKPNNAPPSESEKIDQVLPNHSESGGKASLLETAFREVARVAAESQPPAVSSKASSDAALRQAGAATDNERNPSEAARQAETTPLALSTDNPTSARGSAAALADPSAAAFARQIESPLLEMARQLAQRETRTLRLQLRPEKFGQINLQITRGGDGRLSAQLAADLHVTQHALAEGINQLRQSLEQSGLAIDRLEVSLGLDLQGKAGGQATPEETATAAYGRDAEGISSEPTADPHSAAGDAQGRRLSLRI